MTTPFVPASVPASVPVSVPASVPVSVSTAPAAKVEARLAHLFRAARRAGRIHPLQHLLQRYRATAAPPAGGRP